MAESPTPSVAPSQLFFKNNLMHFEAAAGIATRKEKWVRPDFGRTAENFSRPSQIKKTTGEVPRLQAQPYESRSKSPQLHRINYDDETHVIPNNHTFYKNRAY